MSVIRIRESPYYRGFFEENIGDLFLKEINGFMLNVTD